MKFIRHIATSFNGKNVAFAEFTKTVQILDIEKNNVISDFETILDFGGRRIIISEDGNICVCGCWERYGICGYDTKSGKKIWERNDLKKVQIMQLIRFNSNIFFANFEDKSSELIEINSGKTKEKIRGGIKGYYESKFHSVNVMDYNAKINVIDRDMNKKLFSISRQSFATLDISFSYDSILISESGSPLSCYDISNGKLLWRTKEIDGEHFLRLSYNEKINLYVGISWQYIEGGNKQIKYINSKSGKIENEIFIGNPSETEFAFDGKYLITSEREIIEIGNGKKIKLL